MDGVRHTVVGADGVGIGLLSAGSGPPLLIVHGGVGQIERWEPLWDRLSARWHVTAMDRRGRGSSGDDVGYAIGAEFADVSAVASALAEQAGRPVDVFGHSFGATCTLGAAGLTGPSGPFGRLVLYEPPAAAAVTPGFVETLAVLVDEGRAGKAMVVFLTEVIGLTSEEVDALRASPPAYDILAVLSATLPREAVALQELDLPGLAAGITCPSLFLLGERSPEWAHTVTRSTAEVIDDAEVAVLPGLGHEAIDAAPDLVVGHLDRFLT